MVQTKAIGYSGTPLIRPPQKWTKRQTGWMGKIPDTEIARRNDRSPALVELKCRELGIPIVRK